MIFAKYIVGGRGIYQKYERWLTPAAFLLGFVWDNITLRRIDLFYENISIIWSLFLAGGSIFVINALYEKYKFARFAPYVLQFSFGSLFSAFFVFYFRSASLIASWPFILFLAVLFFGNDFLRKHYVRLTFQLSIFFIALFSYAVFALPILTGKIGMIVFAASGLLALGILAGVAYLLYKAIPAKIRSSRRSLLSAIGALYLFFNVAYFANIIPPIPLSLKESGVYHSLERIIDEKYIYKVSFEPAPRYLPLKEHSDTLHLASGSPIYFYSSVFAPTKISTQIFHHWLYFDEEKKDWREVTRAGFPIIGGRDGGYRGYSYKTNGKPGKWRVEVITESGQVLGRRDFKVAHSESLPQLKTALK